ncbi:peptidoglycan-binding domain-containing protein [Tianweitania sediminis]|uniref:Peptidoglycan-binding domain-containing protein n=2 Tax=Tianweitania sediminis TaxID=1502156 RepID=A0A8J7UK92_9HYPH|nr:peptidoglycan-binding domain-containing protein [Tianweitania sediminis]
MSFFDKRYPGIRWCGHRDLSPDRNGNGIIEPFEHLKACPVFDVIPWAESKGFAVADIRGTWKPVVLEAGTAPVLEGPDTRDAYLQRLLTRAGFVLGPIDGIIGEKTKAATRAFQSSVGLKQTGTLDATTVARLRGLFEVNQAA